MQQSDPVDELPAMMKQMHTTHFSRFIRPLKDVSS
jgi:hypothetical protein